MHARVQRIAVVCAALAAANTGCSSLNNTERGALIGGGVGSVAGTLIGAATGNPRTGAVVGGLGGAAIGGLAGNAEDKREAADQRAELQQARAEVAAGQNQPLGMMDVVKMSIGENRVSDSVIINYIRQTHSRFHLSPEDIRYLKDNGVSDPVVNEMISTGTRPRYAAPPRERVIYRETPVIVEQPVYAPVYVRPRPYCPPPGIGFHFHHFR